MNIVDIVLLCIIILTAIIGYYRGIAVSLISLMKFLIGIPLSFYVSKTFSVDIYNLFVRDMFYNRVYDSIKESDAQSAVNEISDFISTLPSFIKDGIDINNISGLNNDKIAAYVTDNISKPILVTIINILLFLLTLLVFYILCAVISAMIKHHRMKNENSLVKKTGSILGGIFGLLKGCLLVIALSSFAYFLFDSFANDNNMFIKQLDSSVIIEFINEYNPLL